MQGAYTFFNLIAISFGKRDFFFLFIILQNLSLEQTKSPNEQFLFITIYVSLY